MNAPLDQFDFVSNQISAKEIIALLQQNGFNQAYEIRDGEIVIDGQSSLDCRVTKDANSVWQPEVSISWWSGYIWITGTVFGFLAGMTGYEGWVVKILGLLVGLGIGSIMLDAEKKKTLRRLEDALFE